MTDVTIEALRPFNRTPQGDICEAGDVFPVSASRAEELERLGLAKHSDEAASAPLSVELKAAPEPSNKAAPAPRNKKA
ncbi:hypothetical protein [Bosea sp. (in: a-proteobacteria)]|uniref:hypothetical protein n=1 Tax=Bosea sp. (in: a-proteobacteria) TaxID=1871050 RepID=UPI003B3B99BA